MNPFFNHEEDRIRAGWRIAGQFFLALFIGLLLTALLRLFFATETSLIFSISIAAGALLSTWAAANGLDKRLWSEYGIASNKKWLKECFTGFALAGLVMAVIFFIEYVVGWLTVTGFGWQQNIDKSYLWPFISYLLFMILVGFYEELIFRGYQIVNMAEGLNLPSVSRKQAVVFAVIFTSFLFGVLHWRNPNADLLSTLNITLAGFMLAFPFLITGRLSYSIGLHIGWNFFQGGMFGFAVSGVINRSSLIQINEIGPEWITGGAFGPEAGMLGLFGMILVTASLILFFKVKGQSIDINNRFGKYDEEFY